MPRTYAGENDAKYQKLFKMYKRAHPDKLGTDVNDEVIKIWKDTLEKGKSDSLYKEYMAGLDRKIERNSRNNIKACFARHPLSREEFEAKEKEKVREKMEEFQEKGRREGGEGGEGGKEKGDMQEDKESDEEVKGVEEGGEEGVEGGEGEGTKGREKPVQEKSMREIESKEKELAFLIEKRDLDQGQHAVSIANRIKEVRQERDMLRKVLKRKQDNLKSVHKMRQFKREAQEKLHRDHPNLAKEMKVMIMTLKMVSLTLIMVIMMMI